jgi:dihydroorotate dehydrogenase electron transfer subunit
MRTSPQEKWLEILFKVVGLGTRLLSIREPGEPLNLLGPIGRPFEPLRNRPRTLLLGGGVGIPPMIFLADVLRRDHHWKPFIIMGSEVPFPFNIKPSRLILRGIPPVVDAAMSMMEKGGIPSRLTSLQGFSGCFNGQVTDLAKYWLDRQHPQSLATVQVLACGPEPMLRAARIRSALPGIVGGIYGLCCGGVCRMRGQGEHQGGARHKASLRRRPRI